MSTVSIRIGTLSKRLHYCLGGEGGLFAHGIPTDRNTFRKSKREILNKHQVSHESWRSIILSLLLLLFATFILCVINSLSSKQSQWVELHISRVLTRGSEVGQSNLKLFSAEEGIGLLPVLSPWNHIPTTVSITLCPDINRKLSATTPFL